MSESRKAILKQAAEDASSLSLTDALQLEADVENAHDGCPECGEDFEDVGLSNGGTVMFVHDSDGMFTSGCKFEDITEVHPDGE